MLCNAFYKHFYDNFETIPRNINYYFFIPLDSGRAEGIKLLKKLQWPMAKQTFTRIFHSQIHTSVLHRNRKISLKLSSKIIIDQF